MGTTPLESRTLRQIRLPSPKINGFSRVAFAGMIHTKERNSLVKNNEALITQNSGVERHTWPGLNRIRADGRFCGRGGRCHHARRGHQYQQDLFKSRLRDVDGGFAGKLDPSFWTVGKLCSHDGKAASLPIETLQPVKPDLTLRPAVRYPYNSHG